MHFDRTWQKLVVCKQFSLPPPHFPSPPPFLLRSEEFALLIGQDEEEARKERKKRRIGNACSEEVAEGRIGDTLHLEMP